MIYRICRFIYWVIFKFFFCFRVVGENKIPLNGAYILAPNHVSYLDPPLVGACLSRHVNFVAKEELFRIPVLGFLLRKFRCIPIKRGKADRSALRKVVEVLKEGKCVCIFPEGTRVPPGVIKKGEPGAVLLAGMARVPIIPLGIVGTRPFYRKIFGVFPWFSRIEVRVGEVLNKEHWNNREDTDFLMSKIRELLDDH